MRQEPHDRRVTGRDGAGTAGRRLILVLGVVAAVMVGLVIYRAWPAWIADAGREVVDQLLGRVQRTWQDTGGRWVTLAAATAAIAIGALLARRDRTLGIVLIEAAIAVAAVAALLQPAGW